MSSTLVFAHRGAPLEAAENSRAAFAKALARPVDGAETDIQLSLDGVPALWHDDDLEKLGLPGRRVADYPLEELRRMNFTGWFDGNPAGAGILSLEELLAEFKDGAAWLLEIKHFAGETAARRRLKVERCLERARLQGTQTNMRFSSFDLESLAYARSASGAYPYIFNSEDIACAPDARALFARHPFLDGLCLPLARADGALVQAAHALGKTLAVYACDSRADIGRALELEVDILVTDRADLALALRSRSNPPPP
jgi:glycerophosphoryl diester phosphodiesterase